MDKSVDKLEGERRAPTIEVETRRLKLRELKQLIEGQNNARYMTPAQFQLLVENLRRDGVLTSAPLVAPDKSGRLEVLSGNHRVAAAIEAGIEEADCIVILTPLNAEQRTAIQLSHNSITGQDDPNVLLRLYQTLDCSWKEYSGLTDDDFKLGGELDLSSLSVGNVKYEEVKMLFLPEEREGFSEALKQIKHSQISTSLAASYNDFDAIFDALIKTKDKLKIHNTAVALRAMADLALERLAEIEATKQVVDKHGEAS